MVIRTDRKSQKRARGIRLAILLAVLATSTVIGLVHSAVKGAAPAGVDALCPFGAIESAFSLLTAGTFIQKIAVSSVVLLVATVIIGIVFRRSFCGQICPLGTIQELFGRLGRRLFGKQRAVPAAIDRPARYLKYAVLAVFAAWTWAAGELVMRPYDPWATYHHLTSDELLTEFPIGLAVLGVTIAGSLVYDRFFCKYLCPMGAFLGIISRFSIFKVRRDADACTDCGACDRACPMNVTVSTAATVEGAECIGCNECVNACPSAGALNVRAGVTTKAMTLPAVTATALVLGSVLLVLGVTTATGTFSWTTKSLTAAAPSAGEKLDTAEINGRTSLAEIAEVTGLPLDALLERFKVPASEADAPMKEIKDTYDFSPEDVRAYVDEQLAAVE